MAQPAKIVLAPDSTGKQVVMEEVTLGDGTVAYRQVASLGGESMVILQQLLENSIAQLKCLRALVRMTGDSVISATSEEDFNA